LVSIVCFNFTKIVCPDLGVSLYTSAVQCSPVWLYNISVKSVSNTVVLNEQTFVPVSELTGNFSYSVDYITRLAREKKIKALQLERRWYVYPASLESYAAVQEWEKEVRQKQLKTDRKREQLSVERSEQSLSFAAGAGLASAVVCGLLFAGGIVGLGFMVGESFDSPKSLASVAGSVEQSASDVDQNKMITPQFTFDNTVVVDRVRSIDGPETVDSWTYIQHE